MIMSSLKKVRRGFTLIELLLVIGIIAILASIVIVAINPTKQLADARNTQRRSDVNTLINAIYQYSIDEDGNLPGCLDAAVAGDPYNVCTAASCTGYVAADNGDVLGCDLSGLTGDYLVGIPTDPQGAPTAGYTGYQVEKDADDRVTVTATAAERSETISVQR